MLKNVVQCVLVMVLGIGAGVASASLVHVGTYTYSQAPDGFGSANGDKDNAGPIAYTTSSIQGDGDTTFSNSAGWNNGNNQLHTNGITITFDLGSNYYVSEVTTKHYTKGWWGTGPVNFYYSTNGTDYTSVGSDGTNQSSHDDLGVLTRSKDYSGAEARYIKLQCHSVNWYHLALSEVEIDAAPVPEPATIGLMMLGFGFLHRVKK